METFRAPLQEATGAFNLSIGNHSTAKEDDPNEPAHLRFRAGHSMRVPFRTASMLFFRQLLWTSWPRGTKEAVAQRGPSSVWSGPRRLVQCLSPSQYCGSKESDAMAYGSSIHRPPSVARKKSFQASNRARAEAKLCLEALLEAWHKRSGRQCT